MPKLTITSTTVINASAAVVWDVLVDFPRYESWNPLVRITGTPTVGSKLTVLMGPGAGFHPRVLVATPGRELRWLGRLGIPGLADGEHFFVLTDNSDGTTTLEHGENYSGVLVALAGSKANNNDSYAAFSNALKKEVESTAPLRRDRPSS